MKDKLTILAIISALPLLLAMAGRHQGDVRGPAVGVSYSYEYYPDAEVYYEPHHHVYYWSDGGAWRSGACVPQNIVLRSSVRVDLDTPEPYRHHDEVRTKYPRHRGDPRGPAVGVSYSYEYYPDAEVYYEPHHHVYYWSDGGAWRSGARVPQNIVLRSSVRVDLDTPEPYRHHDEVRTKYPRHMEEKERGR